jgi:hypothetical protein
LVLALRRHGCSVHAAGTEHRVDGRVLSTSQLRVFAKGLGLQTPQPPTQASILTISAKIVRDGR